MVRKNLQKIIAEKDTYDKESRGIIESLQIVDKEISKLNEMKATAGWKILDKKIRTELHLRINELVKDDLKIQTLLALLTVADTTSMSNVLDAGIDEILPE